jgi:integration host factor subunit alpha
MTLTKQTLIDGVISQCDLSRSQARKAIETLLEVIKRTLESGEDVLISGFGKFCVREKKERKGRNPATGEDLTLRPRSVVTFQCSSVLKDKINGKARRRPTH